MAQICKICAHAARDAIDAAIRTPIAHATIAHQYGVTRDSVRRHAQSHLPETQQAKREARANASHNRARMQGENILPDALGQTQQAFLAAFVRDCNESAALREAHIDRKAVRYWEEFDETFSARYNEAKRQVDDAIDGEIARRALIGVPEPVVSAGKVIYKDDGTMLTVQKYSDRMLELLAKAHHAKYRDKSQVDVTSNGATVGQGVPLPDLATLQDQVAQRLIAWRQGQGTHDDDLGPN